MQSRPRQRLSIELLSNDQLTPHMTHRLGQIMQDAVYEDPWRYHDWPLGELNEPPGPQSAVGYIRLCDTFLVLNHEVEGNPEKRPVGVWAGSSLRGDRAQVFHLENGSICPRRISDAFGPNEPARVDPEKDFYHLIIAIDGPVGVDNRPLENHRSTKMKGGKHAARVMMEFMLGYLKLFGFERLWTKTHPEQMKMVRLFTSLGLKPVGDHFYSHGKSGAQRTIFACKPGEMVHPDNSDNLSTDWH